MRGWLAGSLVVLSACGKAADSTPTWNRDVRPLVEAKCAGCHVKGGIAPFAFAASADVRQISALVKAQVTSRKMPPWPASHSCTQYSPDASLTDAQIATITGWLDSGALEGEVADYAPMTEDTVITGYALVPGQPSMIHHADIFYIKPSHAAEFQANDTGDGYECYTVPILEGGWIGTFVPGNRGVNFPDDSGLRMEPGSKIFIQTHYNTAVTGPLPDLSKLNLSLTQTVRHAGAVIALSDPDWINNETMTIPAFAPDVMHRYTLDPTPFLSVLGNDWFINGKPIKLWAGTLHMHQLGSSAKIEIQRADGGLDCITDIPQWDFAWQLPYSLAEPKILNPGDQLAVECHWNNSAENQPFVNGVQLVSRDNNWGTNTTDEMCVGGVYMTQ